MTDRLNVSDNNAMLRFAREHCPAKRLDDSGEHEQACPGCAALLNTLLVFVCEIAPHDHGPGTAGWALMQALRGEGCLGRSAADEPVFTLVARDVTAAATVLDWAGRVSMRARDRGVPEPTDKIIGAMSIAQDMEAWRGEHGGGKVPD